MKIQLMSDLHFEFGWKMKLTPHKDTILVLAGDVDSRHKNLGDFIKYACDNYKEVIMVAGNHEFYHNDYHDTMEFLMNLEWVEENFRFLEDSSFIYEGVHFIGATLWSDPDWGVFKNIADSELVQFNGHRLLDIDIRKMNRNSKQYIKTYTENPHPETNKTVVITHFGPDQALMHPKWRGNPRMNTYFWADGLQDTFKNVDYWFFGHTHDPIKMVIDGCTFVCNPNGYVWPGGAGREHWNFNEELILEI